MFRLALAAGAFLGALAVEQNPRTGYTACNGAYAACADVPCHQTLTANVYSCLCPVKQGWSASSKACSDRLPTRVTDAQGNLQLQITSSFAPASSGEQFNVCDKSQEIVPVGMFANCLDAACTVSQDGTVAECQCPGVTADSFLTLGTNCDGTQCSQAVWSGATYDKQADGKDQTTLLYQTIADAAQADLQIQYCDGGGVGVRPGRLPQTIPAGPPKAPQGGAPRGGPGGAAGSPPSGGFPGGNGGFPGGPNQQGPPNGQGQPGLSGGKGKSGKSSKSGKQGKNGKTTKGSQSQNGPPQQQPFGPPQQPNGPPGAYAVDEVAVEDVLPEVNRVTYVVAGFALTVLGGWLLCSQGRPRQELKDHAFATAPQYGSV